MTEDWDTWRSALDERDRDVALAGLALPPRVLAFVANERLATLGELAAMSRAQLMRHSNLGRRTVSLLPQTLRDGLAAHTLARARIGTAILRWFDDRIEQLHPSWQRIATGRAGRFAEPITLEALGGVLGVTRERVRQIEAKICKQLARDPWTTDARQRIERVLGGGAVPLRALADDPWWAGVLPHPGVVAFVVGRVLDMPAYVWRLDDTWWISRHEHHEIEAAMSAMFAAAHEIVLPILPSVFDALATRCGAPFGPAIARLFADQLRARLKLASNDGKPGVVVGYGDSRDTEVLALLRDATAPMRIDEIQQRIGARLAALPDEVLYFGPGRVGLREHVDDFDGWQARLVPVVAEWMEELAPERQWSCGELFDELRETHELPDWLTPYGLGSLLRTSGRVRYLGRLRVALPGAQDDDARVHVHDELEQILREAGKPMPRAELTAQLHGRLGAAPLTVTAAFWRREFVRVDAKRIGLLSRDVPGGKPARVAAGDRIATLLEARGRGLSQFHAHAEVIGISAKHRRWTPQLVGSVLRADGRFRADQIGAIGLAQWESVRLASKVEIFRRSVAVGRVRAETVLKEIEAEHGERPSHARWLGLLAGAGLRVEGGWIVRR